MIIAVCKHLAAPRGISHIPFLSSLKLISNYRNLDELKPILAGALLEQLVLQRTTLRSQAPGGQGSLRKLAINTLLVPDAVDLAQYIEMFEVVPNCLPNCDDDSDVDSSQDSDEEGY